MRLNPGDPEFIRSPAFNRVNTVYSRVKLKTGFKFANSKQFGIFSV